MKNTALVYLLCAALCAPAFCPQELHAQEAAAGVDLRATLTGQALASSELTEEPRSGSPITAGFRSVLYPTWKINDHWTVTGAWQLYSYPFFFQDLGSAGNGVKGNILQASINYARVSDKGSLLLRAGQLSTSFGSFMLRYDDADNPLVDMPIEYGYYYAPVSTLGLPGAQVDVTRGKWDARAQFANSSPANPRSLFAHDQYGNWAGGAGYTIRQGLRIGVSGYRGPYLDRQYAFFFPGEANPSTLPAQALGLDAAWSRGHWTLQGEWQKFVFAYTAIPIFREQAGYAEVKRALGPRWYAAARENFTLSASSGTSTTFEAAGGFRPNRLQLIKFEYEFEQYGYGSPTDDQTFAIQLVTTLHSSAARN